MSTTVITCHYCKKLGHKVKYCKRKFENEFDVESQKKIVTRERKSGVATITVATRMMRSFLADEKVRKI